MRRHQARSPVLPSGQKSIIRLSKIPLDQRYRFQKPSTEKRHTQRSRTPSPPLSLQCRGATRPASPITTYTTTAANRNPGPTPAPPTTLPATTRRRIGTARWLGAAPPPQALGDGAHERRQDVLRVPARVLPLVVVVVVPVVVPEARAGRGGGGGSVGHVVTVGGAQRVSMFIYWIGT